MTVSLCVVLSLVLVDPPPSKPAAMLMDRTGKVEIRPPEGPAKVAEPGDLLYAGERLVVPAGGMAVLAIHDTGVLERIKPGSEATVSRQGCTPPGTVESKQPPRPVLARAMKGIKADPMDRRKAGVGLRAAPEHPLAVTPIHGATIVSLRPALTWPASDKAKVYRVKLLSGAGVGRVLWQLDVKEPTVAFPEGKEPLQRGYPYRWEVADDNFQPLAAGEFAVATESEVKAFAELEALGCWGDRADQMSAAVAFERLGAFAEAMWIYECLLKYNHDEPAYRHGLEALRSRAGLRGADSGPSAAKSQ